VVLGFGFSTGFVMMMSFEGCFSLHETNVPANMPAIISVAICFICFIVIKCGAKLQKKVRTTKKHLLNSQEGAVT
jgi:hypothetical protein